ncbi:MAG: GNAT family N-acetyltransferase [Candidatus Uhrbacteria bacterium]
METPSLRQFQESDKDDVKQLHIEGLKQTGSYIDDSELDIDLENIRETYTNSGGEFLVVSLENKIIGMGALRKVDDETAEIKRMRVAINYQGHGVGSLILDRLIEKARELGYKKIILDTNEKQEAARRLYEKKGFKEFKRKKTSELELVFYELDIN